LLKNEEIFPRVFLQNFLLKFKKIRIHCIFEAVSPQKFSQEENLNVREKPILRKTSLMRKFKEVKKHRGMVWARYKGR